MPTNGALDDRYAFAERMRLQIASRYGGATVEVDGDRFRLRVTGPGVETSLPLAPLHQACTRDPANAPALIASFVASVEKQLTSPDPAGLSTSRLLWCVRNAASIAEMARAADLMSVRVGATMVGFIAEALPGSIMRGVPRQEWEAAGLNDDAVRAVADVNTERHFERLVGRIRRADRVPSDGWRVAGDPLFQGSILLVPAVLEALRTLAGGDVLLGAPDRGVAYVLAAGLPAAARFDRRVRREWREAMNPCSSEVLVYDGESVRTAPRPARKAGTLVLPWLME